MIFIKIINIRNNPEYKEQAIEYFQKIWANEASKPVYSDSITRSLTTDNPLPIWYLLLGNDEEIVGCVGLITNDFISCMDLYPWLAALYIEKAHRGNNYAKLLIDAVKADTKCAGFKKLYLCTDHDNYYEKFGFEYICDGHHPWGESSKVYECEV